jgi:putative ABC transport system permease protein
MLRFCSALFGCTLALCPPGFRRAYGAAMRDDFATAFRDERNVHGPFGATAYALGAIADLFTTAVREYAAMLFRDFSYAIRSLRKTPSFSAVVIATLALAIGANTAVFSILHAVVLSPLPYAEPDRLIELQAELKGHPFDFSLPDFSDVVARDANDIASAAAFNRDSATLTGRGEPRTLVAISTTTGLFDTLGVRPELGRFATEADTARGAAKRIVISDALWRQTFAADRNILGRLVRLDGDPYRIIGVAPADFRQPYVGKGFQPADLWKFVPQNGAGTQFARGYHTFGAVARLTPGATLARVRATANLTTVALASKYPADDTDFAVHARSLTDSLVGSARTLLFSIFAAVGAVLLVACANVANLLLSRAASRDREFSVRIAIGATRGHIIAQLLVETFVLACGGGVLGIAIGYGAVAAFAAFHPANIPRADTVSVNGLAIAYTFGVVAFCTLAAGLAPAFASTQRDVAESLKSAGRGGDGNRGARARNALVSCEIAITLALVIAAGLVVRSFVALTAQPLGFDPSGLELVGPIEMPDKRYGTDAARLAMMDRIERRVSSTPGVAHVAWVFGAPYSKFRIGTSFTEPGHAIPIGHEPESSMASVGAAYFTTMHATLRAGRAFTDADRPASEQVAIVNESFARTFFPGGSAIGRRIVPGLSIKPGPPPARTIVGVVDDIRVSFTVPNDPEIYVPVRQFPLDESYLAVRGTAGAQAGASAAATVSAFDPLVARPDVAAMSALTAKDVATQRLSLAALCALASVALMLSLAGVFAVVSYGVTQRTHEFGIRMALGADARQIVRMVLVGALRLAAIGIVLGLFIAGAGTRLIADQLYDTQPLDPLTFGAVTLLVIVAALLAALVPASRATRVDPIVALRYE